MDSTQHTSAEAVIGVLSLAAVQHGVSKVPIRDFRDHLNFLHREFPALMPEIPSRDLFERFRYSSLVMNDDEFSVMLEDDGGPRRLDVSAGAARNIARLRERRGDGFLKRLEPIAHLFAQLLKQPTPPQAA